MIEKENMMSIRLKISVVAFEQWFSLLLGNEQI